MQQDDEQDGVQAKGLRLYSCPIEHKVTCAALHALHICEKDTCARALTALNVVSTVHMYLWHEGVILWSIFDRVMSVMAVIFAGDVVAAHPLALL